MRRLVHLSLLGLLLGFAATSCPASQPPPTPPAVSPSLP